MKKIFLLLLLLVASVSAFAQKSYITVTVGYDNGRAPYGSGETIILTGDVPDGLENFVYSSNYHDWYLETGSYDYKSYSTGEILNLLASYGYEVEVAIDSKHFLLSKEIPSGNQTIIEGDVNQDNEVNIADVNAVVNIILGLAKSNPSIMKQLKEQLQ